MAGRPYLRKLRDIYHTMDMSKFDVLAAELARKKGVTDPRALAAAIGRKKYGAREMARAAAAKRPARK